MKLGLAARTIDERNKQDARIIWIANQINVHFIAGMAPKKKLTSKSATLFGYWHQIRRFDDCY